MVSQASRPANDFRRLIDQVRGGSQSAAWELIEIYGPHVLRVVRRTLDRRLRSKFDSIDFVQAAWASFFRGRSRLIGIENPDQLIHLLTAIARSNVVDEYRRHLTTEKYDLNREERIDQCPAFSERALGNGSPRPSEVAVARETWDRLIESQPPVYREIVNMRFLGATHVEIAEKLRINERTVRRVLEKLLKESSS